jgi:hypothetical protein
MSTTSREPRSRRIERVALRVGRRLIRVSFRECAAVAAVSVFDAIQHGI